MLPYQRARIAPQDGVSGKDVKAQIGSTFALSWTLACGMWAKDFGACTSNTNYGKNFLTATLVAPATSNIDEATFYRKKSVEECLATVSNFTRMFGQSYLTSKEQTSVSNNVKIRFISQSDLDDSVIFLGLIAPKLCNPDETGQVLEAGGTGF